jgi:hypothetical protein
VVATRSRGGSRLRHHHQKPGRGGGGLAANRPVRGPRGPKKDQTERTRMDSSGHMGAPFTEGKRGRGLWSRLGADPPLAASIPAASTWPQILRNLGPFLFLGGVPALRLSFRWLLSRSRPTARRSPPRGRSPGGAASKTAAPWNLGVGCQMVRGERSPPLRRRPGLRPCRSLSKRPETCRAWGW